MVGEGPPEHTAKCLLGAEHCVTQKGSDSVCVHLTTVVTFVLGVEG